jgi:putative hydrolase of the HAD superfamily
MNLNRRKILFSALLISYKDRVTFRFVYFDIDDTLLNHRHAERAALQEVRNAIPVLQKIPIETLWETYNRINRDLWDQYGHGEITRVDLQHLRFSLTLSELGISLSFQETISQTYMKLYRRLWSWVPDAEKALADIAAKWPVGFLTNGFAEVQQAKAEKFHLREISDIYVISEEVGCMKPSACIFQHATELAGVDKSEILYVGDSYKTDIIGAKRFGWQTVWLTDQNVDPEGVADMMISGMGELSLRLNHFK